MPMIIDFEAASMARAAEVAKYDERLDRIGAMIPILASAINEMRKLDADSAAIARVLRHAAEELTEFES
jgi:hypothetical protein